MTTPNAATIPKSDFLAAEEIKGILRDREKLEQERIIRWVSESLGIALGHVSGTIMTAAKRSYGMETVSGQTLRVAVRSGILRSAAGVVAIALQACSGCGDGSNGTVADASADRKLDGVAADRESCSEVNNSCSGALPEVVDGGGAASAVFGLKWSYSTPESAADPVVLPLSGLVAFRVGLDRVEVVDQETGSLRGSVRGSAGENLAPSLSADAAENLYFVGDRVYSTDSGLRERWNAPLRGPFPRNPANPGISGAPALHGSVAFFAATDGRVYALATSDGHELWAQDVPVESSLSRLAGRGDTLVVPSLGEGAVALDTETGAKRWNAPRCPRLSVTAAPVATRLAFVIGEYDLSGSGPDRFNSFAIGICGQQLADLPPSVQTGVLEARDGRVLAAASDTLVAATRFNLINVGTGARSTALTLGGESATSRTFRFDLVAIGDDDVAYIMETYNALPITADPLRARLFRVSLATMVVEGVPLELGAGEGTLLGSAMDDNGVLYISVRTRVVAVQTPSPGPARGRWAMRNGNARGALFIDQ